MAQQQLRTTRHALVHGEYLLAFVVVVTIASVEGTCTFPSALSGAWVRGHDSQSLTFSSSSQVSGLDIEYSGTAITPFSCRESSGNTYVISSDPYTTAFSQTIYYICWELVKVTDSAYLLYELSNQVTDGSYNNQPGYYGDEANDAAFAMADACHKTTSTQLFTTLIKQGASSSDVAVECPSSLLATFSYALCADTELDFCSDKKTATANYTKCATQIFNSAGGVLSCMGDATVGSYTYLNMYSHDAGNDVTCFKFQDNGGGSISGEYYTGDCTTSSSTSLTLTKTHSCVTPVTLTTLVTPLVIPVDLVTLETLVTPVILASTKKPNISESDSSSEVSAGIIAGAVIGGLAFIALAAVIAIILIRKKNASPISEPDPEKTNVVNNEKPSENGSVIDVGEVLNGDLPAKLDTSS